MTYVMSDIHGCYDEYLEMLRLIDFKDKDTLFVLGVVIDRGEKPVEVLMDMSKCANVFPIIGNHEFAAVAVLEQILTQARFVITEESIYELEHESKKREDMLNLLEDIREWEEIGGDTTIKGFGKLSLEEKESIVDYLEEFSLFEVVSINNKTYILTHSGVPEGATLNNLDDFDAYAFIMNEIDYNKVYFDDAILVTGHLPIVSGKELTGKIWYGNNHIRIDTGCVFGGTLSCLCLDTGEEFYVTNVKKENYYDLK